MHKLVKLTLLLLLAVPSAFAQSSASGGAVASSASGTTGSTLGSRAWAPGPLWPDQPLSTVDVTFPDISGFTTVTSSSAADLQTKVTNAVCDQIISIPAGSNYNIGALSINGLVLSSKSCTAGHWPIIRTAGFTPTRGTRIDPSTQVGTIAKLTTATAVGRILSCASNVPCGPFWILGIEFECTGDTSACVLIPRADSPITDNTVLPHDLIFDTVYIHGRFTNKTTRCFGVSANNLALVDSYLSECHDVGTDSQAFNSFAGCPQLYKNDFLEASGENRLTMGSNIGPINTTLGLFPCDVTEDHNWYYKPMEWYNRGTPTVVYAGFNWDAAVKNLWESKGGVRQLVKNSIFQNVWVAAQVGKAFLNNQAPSTNGPFSYSSDTTFQYNHVIGGAAAMFASGKDGNGQLSPGQAGYPNDPFFISRNARVMWRHVLFEDERASWCGINPCPSTGNQWLGITNGVQGVIIDHVTITSDSAEYDGVQDATAGNVNPPNGMVYITNSILPNGVKGFHATGFSNNDFASVNAGFGVTQLPVVQRNAWTGMPGASVTAWNTNTNFTGTSGPAAQSNIGYVNYATVSGDYRLCSAFHLPSVLCAAASSYAAGQANGCKADPDGSGGDADCGADVTGILAATAGADTPPALWPDSLSGGHILLTTSPMTCNGSNTLDITAVAGTAGGSLFVQSGLDVLIHGAIVAPGASSTSSITVTPPTFTGAASITNTSLTTNIATYTASNGYHKGDRVTVTGLPSNGATYNVTDQPVNSATATTFTVNIPHANITSLANAGAALATIPVAVSNFGKPLAASLTCN